MVNIFLVNEKTLYWVTENQCCQVALGESKLLEPKDKLNNLSLGQIKITTSIWLNRGQQILHKHLCYGFSSSHVWMWELDYKEGWAPKNWCFWTVVLQKILESPLDSKEIQPVHPKGNQSWIFTGRTDAEAETPILWPLDVKNWLIGKDFDAGKDWRWEEKGMIEDEMIGWNHQLNGVNSRSWWWTGKPGVLQPMGSQRVGHDWATELNWTLAPSLRQFSCVSSLRSPVHICIPCWAVDLPSIHP